MPRPDPSEPLSVTNNAISLLKVRNISLVNKITALRREVADISSYKNEYEQKSVALDTNLSLFKQFWAKHINELKSLRQQQKPFGDQKLQQEFEECLSAAFTALDSLAFQQPQEEFYEKTAPMFAALSKLHKDVITGTHRVLEGAIEKLTNETEQTEDAKEEGLNNLSSFQQKLKEFSESIESIKDINMKIEENSNLVEAEALKKKVEKLEEELADVKEYNEVLNRRNKVELRGFMEVDEDLEKEIELGCICGGKLFDYLTIQNIKVNREVEEDEEEKKVNDGPSEATNKDIAILNQKIEKLEKDLQEVTEEKLVSLTQNEKLKQEKRNMDEVFFNSKLYQSVVLQAQDLLKYISMLKSKMNQYEKILKDFEKLRMVEMEEVFKKMSEDKDKFVGMIKEISISYDNEKKKFEQLDNELVKEYDLSVKFNSFLQIMEQNDQRYTNLNKENDLLRNQVKEYSESLHVANSQVTGLNHQLNELTQQNQKLRAKIPGELNLDDLPFRHSKHREFLNEMHNINKKNNLNIKEKIDDLKIYIKTREEKVEHMEAKIKNLNNEIAQGKKQADQLIKEVELNSKIANDVDTKYHQLSSQIRNQNENFANLVKEKVNDRTQFDLEKSTLQNKIRADGDMIEKLQNHIVELNNKIQALTDTKDISEELIQAQKEAIEDNKNIRENLLKTMEEQKTEIAMLKESYDTLDQAQKDFIKENENLKKSLKEKNGFISQKLQRLKKMSNEATITDEEEVEFLKLENDRFKKMITCSVCGLKEKACVLAKCFHTFCRPCITGTMEARNRRCPVCKNKIGIDDIKPLHWDV